MKRKQLLFPLFGLALLAAAWTARGIRGSGLALEPFPPPADVQLEPVELPLGESHLTGTLRDKDGKPVPEALVKVVAGEEPVWTYSDRRGRFGLGGLPAGPQRVVVWTRHHHLNEFRVEAPADGLVLTLERDFGPLPEVPALVTAPLVGELVPALEGRELAGYELALSPLAPPDELGAPVERRVTVGADGRFALEDLLTGAYRLSVLPPWAQGGSWPDLIDPGQASYVHEPAGSELRLLLSAGELRGRVLDERGEPIVGALFVLNPEGAPQRPWPPLATDEAGDLVLRDLPPGDYRLELRAGLAREELLATAVAGESRELPLPPLDVRGGPNR